MPQSKIYKKIKNSRGWFTMKTEHSKVLDLFKATKTTTKKLMAATQSKLVAE